jgi:hypothetical protein
MPCDYVSIVGDDPQLIGDSTIVPLAVGVRFNFKAPDRDADSRAFLIFKAIPARPYGYLGPVKVYLNQGVVGEFTTTSEVPWAPQMIAFHGHQLHRGDNELWISGFEAQGQGEGKYVDFLVKDMFCFFRTSG